MSEVEDLLAAEGQGDEDVERAAIADPPPPPVPPELVPRLARLALPEVGAAELAATAGAAHDHLLAELKTRRQIEDAEAIARHRAALSAGDLRAARPLLEALEGQRRLPDPEACLDALLSSPPVTWAPTGLETLDTITDGGWTAGKFHVIAGEPNVGKTSLQVQLARFALEEGWAVGIHVNDVDDRAGILLRIAQAHGLDRMKFLRRDRETLEKTKAIVRKWRPLLSIVDESADGKIVDDTAEALLALASATGKAPVLFVDSLQTIQLRWPEGREPRTDKDRIDQVVKRLVRWTRLGLTIVATCEIPRGFYTGPKKSRRPREAPPALAAFKGSGNIEYAAWTALVLTRIRGEAEAVRVEVPKNKQGREDVTFKLVRTESRVGYEDAGEMREQGRDEDDAPAASKKPGQENLEPYRMKIRKALAGMPQGFNGNRDELARLAGGKTGLTRTAIATMITSGELLQERPEGQPARLRLRRSSDATVEAPSSPSSSPPNACATCGVPGCPPCNACGGCRRTMPADGGCPC